MAGKVATAEGDVPAALPQGAGRPRVAIVANAPTRYYAPCYRALATLVDLRVVFNAPREPDRDWDADPAELDFPHDVVPSLALNWQRRRADLGGMGGAVQTRLPTGLIGALGRFRPDIVVGLAFGPGAMLAMAHAGWRRARYVLWCDGTRHSEAGLHFLRLTQRTTMVRRADAFWSAGALSTELLASYGRQPRQPVTEAMTGADTLALGRAVAEALPGRDAIRARLGLSGTVLLFAGSLNELDGVPQLVRAVAEARAGGGPRFTLAVAGRGPLADMVGQSLGLVGDLDLHLLGAVPPSSLAELYVAADALVQPTLSDNWSLVSLEAAVAGLPQIFSAHNGGSRDLVAAGANGILVDPLDIGRLAEAICTFAAAPPPRTPAAVTDRIAAQYAPDAFARRAVASFAGLGVPAVPAVPGRSGA